MNAFRAGVLTLVASLVTLAPRAALGQSLVLDPMSSSLPAIPATSADILAPSGFSIPAPPPPVVGITAAALGLLPGDVIDAITYGNDGAPGSTLTLSVTRGSVGVAGPPNNVASEVGGVPVGFQPEAASDLFITLDPACGVPLGFNIQIADGNGMALAASVCGYPGPALGLAELLPLPGPPPQ